MMTRGVYRRRLNPQTAKRAQLRVVSHPVLVISTRLTLIGTSQQRYTLLGTSQKRETLVGSNG